MSSAPTSRVDPEFPVGSVLGHELAGRVAAVGPDVEGWTVGDGVAVLPYRSCGTCRYCASGSENLCVSDELYDRLIAKGTITVSRRVVPIKGGPLDGAKCVYMTDPDGIRVEFLESDKYLDTTKR